MQAQIQKQKNIEARSPAPEASQHAYVRLVRNSAASDCPANNCMQIVPFEGIINVLISC